MKKIMMIAAIALISVAASAQSKFAFVNSNELVQLTDDFMTAQKTLMASQKATQDEYQMMVDEFQKKYSDYQQKAANLTESIKQSKEKELTDIQNRIQEFQQTASQEIQQKQQELMGPVQQKVMDAITKLGKDGGYTFVFDEAQFLYMDKTACTDLNAAAKKALNIPADRTLESVQKALQDLQNAQ